MRKVLIALAAVAGIGLFSMPSSFGAPASGGAILNLAQTESPFEQARLYCVNRYTGRFLYWGRCGGGYRPHYRPRARYRTYCKNRYTGRFLYWGHCRY